MSGAPAHLLVIGKSGQLASALAALDNVTCLGRGEIDILSRDSVAAAIGAHAPRAVINTAAYTSVDQAEREREAAMLLNATAPNVLARSCAAAGVPFVHISTDYVFDGRGGAPYAEHAQTKPVNVYGETKARGEEAVLSVDGQVAVLRTSWLFSERPGNFVTTMLARAGERQRVDVVFDAVGRPTSSHVLARACADLADTLVEDTGVGGIFHFANGGEASWAVLAEAVMEEARARGWKATQIRPVASRDYPTPAQRPGDSRLATDKIEGLLGWTVPHWRTSLRDVLDRVQAVEIRQLDTHPGA